MSRAPGAAPDGSNRPLPERIAELEDERTAIELATAGHTLRQIADVMGCSVSTAFRRVDRGFKRLAPVQEAEVLRARQNTSSTRGSAPCSSGSPRTTPAPRP